MTPPFMIHRALLSACAAALLLACGGSDGSGGSGPSGPPSGAGIVSSVQISASAGTVTVGASLSLVATARDKTGASVTSAAIAWSSSAPNVAAVSASGVVSGVSAGTATITASSSGFSSTMQITVTPDDTPASIALAPSGPLSLLSGSTSIVTATVRTADGRVLSAPAVSYSSSDVAVATVSAGAVTGARIGTATITATAGTVSASVNVTVSAGLAAALGVRTQPVGTAAGSLLSTQPVIEIRDKAGNLVTTAANAVTVAIASGGGSLSGTTTVLSVGGVATFTNLTITGTAGTRTLIFSATALTSATSVDIVLAAPVTPLLVIDTTSVALTALSGKTSQVVILGVKNGGSTPLTGVTVSAPAYDAGQPAGWLAATASGGTPPFTVTLVANAATLVPGVYRAVVQVAASAASNSPVSITVTLTVTPANTITYGTSAEKLRVLDVASAYTPSTTARDGLGQTIPTGTVTYASRATSVATVDAQGKITAVGEGTTWVAVQGVSSADSVFVTVPRSAAGPVLRSDLTTYLVKPGDVTFVNVLIDTRQTPVGAATIAVGYTTIASQVFSVTYTVSAGPPVPVATSFTAGVIRVSVASATPLTGQISLLQLRVVTPTGGRSGVITLTVTDIVAPDGSDLMSVTTSTRIPIIVQ